MIKRIFFFSLFLLASVASQAATNNWTNNSGDNNWSNPANWSLATIPTANDDVVIPPGMGSSACDINILTIQSLKIETGSRVTITAGNRLFIETTISSVTTGLEIWSGAEFINQGIVGIKFALISGILNFGDIRNFGLIDFDLLPNVGLQNFGVFRNEPFSRLAFDEVDGFGILDSGSLINRGSIRFLTGGTGNGMFMKNLQNEEQGTISFEGQNPGEITASGSSSLILNDGRIEFDPETTGDFCLVSRRGLIVNRGVLRLRGGLSGAIHLDSGRLTNGGICDIQGSNPRVSVGILCSGNGILTNVSGRLLEISEVATGIHLEDGTSTMNNAGNCLLSGATFGIYCSGQMLNEESGEITFEEMAIGIDVPTFGNLVNEGTLTFENINRGDIRNAGDFTNEACGTINGDNSITNLGGIFTNYGWLLYPNDGPDHQYSGLQIINVGIILDNYRRFDNVIKNYKIRVLPFVNPRPNKFLKNVWDIANADNIVNSNVTTLSGGGTSVGKLSLSHNYFLPNMNILFASEKVFVKLTDKLNKCSKIIEIRLEHTNAFGNNQEEELLFKQTLPKEKLMNSKVYPNPSSGSVHLRLPASLTGDVHLRLYDLTGQLLWQEERSTEEEGVLDFSKVTSTGIYLLQIMQNGQLIDQRKLLVQKD